MRHAVPHLEMHVTHACNLKCRYCAHFCDYGYTGDVPFAAGGEWLRGWSKRLAPRAFRLLGGEPLLHPGVGEYVRLAAECFPEADRGVTTNGLLLRERESLLPLLIETGTLLVISLHPLSSPRQLAGMEDALALAARYREKGLRLLVVNDTGGWRKLYRGEGDSILPFAQGKPEASRRSCLISASTILHENRLWKCPPLAFLPMIADTLATRRHWEPYLRYQPLCPDAPDEEIAAFLKGDSRFCDMCPVSPQLVSLPGVLPD